MVQLGHGRSYHTSTLIPDLHPYVLAIGGKNSGGYLNSVEEYDIGLGYQSQWQSTITNHPSVTPISSPMHIEGTLFRGGSEADGGNYCHIISNDHPIISVVRVGGGNWQGNGGGEVIYMPLSSSWSETHTDVHPPADAGSGYYRLWSIVNGIPCKWYQECAPGAEETQNLNLKTQISVYPNPYAGTIYVKFTPSSIQHPVFSIRIYDMAGRLVEEKSNIKNQNAKLVIGKELLPGIYFLKIEDYTPVKIIKLRR